MTCFNAIPSHLYDLLFRLETPPLVFSHHHRLLLSMDLIGHLDGSIIRFISCCCMRSSNDHFLIIIYYDLGRIHNHFPSVIYCRYLRAIIISLRFLLTNNYITNTSCFVLLSQHHQHFLSCCSLTGKTNSPLDVAIHGG